MDRNHPNDAGFTLIELLVVMIIIGILAAIAIPVLMNQRQRAHDSATKTDVVNLGQEVATYFVDGQGALSLDFAAQPASVVLSDSFGYTTTISLTRGTAQPVGGGATNLNDPEGWCVALTDPKGADKSYRYAALGGLSTGTC